MFCSNCGGEFQVPVAGRCPLCGTRVAAQTQPAGPGAPPPPGGAPPPTTSPFEDPSLGFFDGLWETVKQVITRPVDFFRGLPDTPDIGRPVLYAVILGTVGGLFQAIWQLVALPMQGMGMPSGSGEVPPELQQMADLIQGPLVILITLVLAPLVSLIGLFLVSGLFHLLLLLFGDGERGFAVTLRVVAYAYTVSLFYAVPICGGLIVMIWSLVLWILGLAQGHRTEVWRVLLAVLLPGLLCICCCIFAFISVMGSAMSAMGGAQ